MLIRIEGKNRKLNKICGVYQCCDAYELSDYSDMNMLPCINKFFSGDISFWFTYEGYAKYGFTFGDFLAEGGEFLEEYEGIVKILDDNTDTVINNTCYRDNLQAVVKGGLKIAPKTYSFNSLDEFEDISTMIFHLHKQIA